MRRGSVLLLTTASAVLTCGVLAGAAGGQTARAAVGAPVLSAARAAASGSTWGKARNVPGPDGTYTSVDAISCASAGNRSAGGVGGEYASRKNYTQYTQAFVADQTNGTWGTAEEVPGTGALNTQVFAYVSSLSCARDGGCGAAGTYHSSTGGGFVANKP